MTPLVNTALIRCAYSYALEDLANGQHADYTRVSGTLEFWGVKIGALNSSKSDFTIKALSSPKQVHQRSQTKGKAPKEGWGTEGNMSHTRVGNHGAIPS